MCFRSNSNVTIKILEQLSRDESANVRQFEKYLRNRMKEIKQISLFKVYMPPGVENSLKDVLHSGYVAEGEAVREFEKKLGEWGENENVICTNSCTSALHLTLAAELSGYRDSYVISTPITCLATNVSIQNLGAKIIWMDVDPQTGMPTSKNLIDTWQALDEDVRKKVGAVIFVLWGGNTDGLEDVYLACQTLGIPLIVDGAQGFGIPIKTADYLCWSFQAVKHITTGDGGCLFVKDPRKVSRLSTLKWFGIDRDQFRTPTGEINWRADVPEIGYKFHMNNITATIGLAQLNDPTIQVRLKKYRDHAEYYEKMFENTLIGSSAHLFRNVYNIKKSSNWVYTAITTADVDKLIVDLKAKGINSSRMHIRNDIYTGFKGAITPCKLNGVKTFEKSHICLPCGWWLTNEDCEYVVESVKKCLEDQK